MPNAIILAAGKSKRFAPFTYEKPKGLFRVKEEILIERQIEQLLEAGISEIYVVVGFMKEQFFYLKEKYGVEFLINNRFDCRGNLLSLYVARKHLGNSYICCADHYFLDNPFSRYANKSYRRCMKSRNEKQKFSVKVSDANVITKLILGGNENYYMTGEAFFSKSFSQKFILLMEKEINEFGVENLFWEEFYAKHIEEITLFCKSFPENIVEECDSVEQLTELDEEF